MKYAHLTVRVSTANGRYYVLSARSVRDAKRVAADLSRSMDVTEVDVIGAAGDPVSVFVNGTEVLW